MKRFFTIFNLTISALVFAQSYPPQAGITGSTAIIKTDAAFVNWANGIVVDRGFINISDPTFSIDGNNKASYGSPNFALGFPDGNVVSLGDGGSAILTFSQPITNGTGYDFAVFENASFDYLELAFVEVSSDGINYFRFPAHSQTQTTDQIGSFGTPNPNYLNNFAGKYYGNYGTPFDLSELSDNPLLDKNQILFVKVIDVIGSINPLFGSQDSFGNWVNESFPTAFTSCGFDLQAVGVINQQVLDSATNYIKSKISIYPNPAKEELNINLNQDFDFEILDISGRIVLYKTKNSQKKIDISFLNIGIYNLKLLTVNNETISNFKFMKE